MNSPDASARLRTTTARSAIWLALASVYVIWGSTYLAIRVAVRTMPPLLMAGARFMIAGAVMYAWFEPRGERANDRPGVSQWRSAAIVGGLLLCIGNGTVVWAEGHVSSGLVALLLAPMPVWMALIERVFIGRRLGARATLGLIAGVAGLALLFGRAAVGHIDVFSGVVLVLASCSWAAGSVYARHAPLPKRPLVSTAMQMLAGGAMLLVAGLARGELASLHLAAFSRDSWLALGYLTVFGSCVAFSAYAWLLRVAPTSLVSTYAYVNPIVAVALGWGFLDETITTQMLGAGAVIVIAVALIVTGPTARAATSAAVASTARIDQRLEESMHPPAGEPAPSASRS